MIQQELTTTKQSHDEINSLRMVLGDIVGMDNDAGAAITVVVVRVAIRDHWQQANERQHHSLSLFTHFLSLLPN
jgi:hypothetical protein